MNTTSTTDITTSTFMKNTRNCIFETSKSTQKYIAETSSLKRAEKGIPPIALLTVDKIVCAQLYAVKVEHNMKLKQLLEINNHICSQFGISIYDQDYREYIKISENFYYMKAKQSKKINKLNRSPLSRVYTFE